MTIKITKTMRYEIEYNKELYDLLSDIQYAVWRIKNKAVSMAWDWQQFSFGYKERFGEYPKPKEIIGKALSPDIYAEVKEWGENIASMTVDSSVQEAVKKFDEEKRDVLAGRQAISQYRRDGSFPIRAPQIKNIERINSKKYSADLSLLSRQGAKERGCGTQIPVILRTGAGANAILDRIIDGTYKLRDSRISKVKKKFYLLITYQFEKEKAKATLDRSRVMGVDLGVVNAAYMAFNFDKYLRYKIEGNEIIAFRQRVEARRNALLRQSKYAGKGRRGRGRKTLLKPIEKLRDKVANFRRTTNHKYSKYIVDMAEKHGCGVIQLEDLSGISDRDTFLKQWSYYELQQFIEYKARERGIEVKYINPHYTSQRCSECGHIADENRKSQAEFECVSCGFKANADFNAARNIALPDIEKRIKDEIERMAFAACES